MGSNSLEQAIDKILDKTGNEILSNLEKSHSASLRKIDDSLLVLEQEYDKIISDGIKEADKIKKQIIGSSDLDARNKQLRALEQAVDDVFVKALAQIANTDRNNDYAGLVKALLDESVERLGTTQVIVFTNSKDRNMIQSTISQFQDAEISDETIDCIGGVIVQSKDGTMKFDNTLDARIKRLKPLIRKEIATIFGVR